MAPTHTSHPQCLDQSTTAAFAAATSNRLCGKAPSNPGVVIVIMTVSFAGLFTNFVEKNPCQLDIQDGVNAPAGSPAYLGGVGAYSWQGFFSTKFVNNPAKDTVIMTMTTPGFDGALPHNLLLVAAANAAVAD